MGRDLKRTLKMPLLLLKSPENYLDITHYSGVLLALHISVQSVSCLYLLTVMICKPRYF